MKTHTVTFYPANREIEAKEGELLLHLAARAGFLLDGSCAGRGTCGKCKIEILDGDAPGVYLACKVKVDRSMKVCLLRDQEDSDRKKTLNHLPESFVPDPYIKKVFLKVARAKLGESRSDLDRIRDACKEYEGEITFSPYALSDIRDALAAKRGQVTLVLKSQGYIDESRPSYKVIGAEVGDRTESLYGMAFDIGTTTIVGLLWDMNQGELLAAEAATNPQTIYGADVISRIAYCMEARDNLSTLQKKVVDACNTLMENACKKAGIMPEEIYDITCVGNTTMSHLFLGVDPSNLARVPFSPTFCEAITYPAKQLGLRGAAGAEVYVLPGIAGHVGSDITAILLPVDLMHQKGNYVAVDIGTNGEILVASDGKIYACSTAAGPAFEGACITCGMRAAKGAVEKVVIKEDIEVSCIEKGDPVGICGSGLVDLMAALLDAGLMGSNGNLLTKEEALEKKLPKALCDRLYGQGADRGIIVCENKDHEPIVFTQKDIREVQLAKGAILGGMLTLLRKLSIGPEDIDRILIAGAFGNYMDKKSALGMGLLPNVDLEKVSSIGNSAGTGASMALLSKTMRQKAEEEAVKIHHQELSQDEDFQELYITCMSFPQAFQ